METTVVQSRSEKMANNSIGGRINTLMVALGWWRLNIVHCKECGHSGEYGGKIGSVQENMVVKRNERGRMGKLITQLQRT